MNLNRFKNKKFRKSEDENDEGYIFDNQINTAKEIVKKLTNRITRRNHVILAAKMQSGKTGVCNAVINIISQTKLESEMMVNKYFIITGMNDCGLKEQTYTRMRQQVIGANADNIYIGKRSKKNLSDNRFFILKNNDLMEYEGDIDNSVIFIDESHYGSNKKNKLTKFLEHHKIDWKNKNDLISRNIYIVSVSATPFEEIASDKAKCKNIVELKSSSDYVGVTEYMNSGLVYESSYGDIAEEGDIFDYIEDAHERMIKDNISGIIIIRTRKFDIIESNDYVAKNFDIFEMYANGKSIEYKKMNELIERLIRRNKVNLLLSKNTSSVVLDVNDIKRIPNKPLIILVKGAFRAGITIDKKYKNYIYMVYDHSSKADTTAQALLGRMCGFRNDNDIIGKTHIYVNKKYAEMYSNWENDFQNREILPCSKVTYKWMPNNYNGEAELASKCRGNISISLSKGEIMEIYHDKDKEGSRVNYMDKIMPKLLKVHGVNLNYDYIGEAVLSGKNNYTASTQTKRFDMFSESSMPYEFRPNKIKKFMEKNKRDYLVKNDLGTSAIYIVLDAEIYPNGEVKGNKRLLIYNVEVGQRIRVPKLSSLYQAHKDTSI